MIDLKEKYKDLQPLPCGMQDFEKSRTNGLLYVDKTEYVHKRATDRNGYCYFLGRPSRFGKSLFLSSLACYFNARKDLFEGLKIMELEKAWKKYEVLRFDLSGCSSVAALKAMFSQKLRFLEEKYGITYNEQFAIRDRFAKVIHTAANNNMQRVVILIDEYDYPMQETINKAEEHEKMRTEYMSIFSVFKSECYYIYKVFLTGILKFTQLSDCSALNNICVISANDEYAGAYGFTQEELHIYFKRYIERLADSLEITYEQAFQAILERYGSYSFSRNLTKVINPYTLLNCLLDCNLGNDWINSGATEMLMEGIDRGEHQMPNWDCEYLDINTLELGDFNKNNFVLFLYQTGYMTIKDFCKDVDVYKLSVPNTEVKEAISKLVIPRLLEKKEYAVNSNISAFRRNFIHGDLEKAMQHLQYLVAGTPYSQDHTEKAIEERFQFILVQVLYLCGFKPQEEVSVATGRIDIVCKTKWRNAIFELKMTRNGGLNAASEQISDRHYAAPFLAEDKELTTFAIEFDSAKKELTDWRIEKVK